MDPSDVTAALLRLTLGVTMLAHGYNHAWGGGRIAGTARWFGSIGMRPPMVHAVLATVTELGCGVLLLLGLLTPLAAGGVLGTVLVALITNHLRNGFFIFRPGEGYEYVLMICIVSAALGAVGGGRASLDNALGLTGHRWLGFVVCLVAGTGAATLTLVTSWRPQRPAPAAQG